MFKKQKAILGLIILLVVEVIAGVDLGWGWKGTKEKYESFPTSIVPFEEKKKEISNRVPAIPNRSQIIGKVLKYSRVNSTLEGIVPEQDLYILEVKLLSIEDINNWENLLKGRTGEIIKLYSKEKLFPELSDKIIEAVVEYRGDERGGRIWIINISNVIEDKEYVLSLKYTKGEKISRETKSSLTFHLEGIIYEDRNELLPPEDIFPEDQESSANIPLDITGKIEITKILQYKDEILDVSNKGEVNKLERKYLKAATTTNVRLRGGPAGALPPQKSEEISPLEGQAVILEREEDKTKVKLKDPKKKLPEEIEKVLEIDDPIKFILPKEAVKIGDKWNLDPQEAVKVFVGGPDISVELTLEEITQEAGQEFARISIKGTTKIEVDKLIIKLPGLENLGLIREIPESWQSFGTISFEGEFLFDFTHGKPISLFLTRDILIKSRSIIEKENQVIRIVFKGKDISETIYKVEKR